MNTNHLRTPTDKKNEIARISRALGTVDSTRLLSALGHPGYGVGFASRVLAIWSGTSGTTIQRAIAAVQNAEMIRAKTVLADRTEDFRLDPEPGVSDLWFAEPGTTHAVSGTDHGYEIFRVVDGTTESDPIGTVPTFRKAQEFVGNDRHNG